MKKVLTKNLLFVIAIVAISFASCKSTPKDADVKTAIETVITANPELNGLMVDVKDGVATISGEAKTDAAKTKAVELITAVKGVKSVVNNATVYVAPPVVPEVSVEGADALTKAVTDALKDFPGVTAVVKDQIATLSGEISKDKLQKLMMGLNALKSMGLKSIDSKGLVKK